MAFEIRFDRSCRTEKGREKIRMTFSAASELEVIGRILFFGKEARLLKPDRLVKEIAKKVKIMHDFYRKD